LYHHNIVLSAIFLALVVFIEYITWLYKERLTFEQEKMRKNINTFLDYFCFWISPALFLLVLFKWNVFIIFSVFIFLLAGAYRIYRFNKEWLINGKYKWLPITYSNYIFAIPFLINYYFLHFDNLVYFYIFLIIVTSYCMVSDKFYIPEY